MIRPSFLATYRALFPALLYGAWLRLRVQFARTVLGSGWIGLSTLLTLVVLGTVYGTLTSVKDWPQYWSYVALGLVSWNALSAAIQGSCTLFERARDRILNQRMPLGVFVLEEWAAVSLSLLIAFSCVLVVIGLMKPVIWLYLVNGGWIGLVNLLLGCLILSLIVSPLANAVADIGQLMPILLQIAFLSSPILFYRQSLGPLAWISRLNPLYGWVSLLRDPFLGNPHWGWQWSVLVIQVLMVLKLLSRLDSQRMRVLRWL